MNFIYYSLMQNGKTLLLSGSHLLCLQFFKMLITQISVLPEKREIRYAFEKETQEW